jgi:hypothetical protein
MKPPTILLLDVGATALFGVVEVLAPPDVIRAERSGAFGKAPGAV